MAPCVDTIVVGTDATDEFRETLQEFMDEHWHRFKNMNENKARSFLRREWPLTDQKYFFNVFLNRCYTDEFDAGLADYWDAYYAVCYEVEDNSRSYQIIVGHLAQRSIYY